MQKLTKITLVLSILQTILIIALLFIKLSGILTVFYNALLISVSLCSVTLLIFAYPIFNTLFVLFKTQSTLTQVATYTQFHSHFLIMAFIIVDQLYESSYTLMLSFSPLFIVFFASAVLMWRTCYTTLKSKIYKFFTTGSTALFVWSLVLTVLGLVYQQDYLSQNLHTLVLCYFALHFAELGFVLLKINRDLKSC